jgi:hypothetical protein
MIAVLLKSHESVLPQYSFVIILNFFLNLAFWGHGFSYIKGFGQNA